MENRTSMDRWFKAVTQLERLKRWSADLQMKTKAILEKVYVVVFSGIEASGCP